MKKELSENNYHIDFPGLQQVDSTVIGDLHIITVLTKATRNDTLSTPYGAELYRPLINQIVVQNAIVRSLQDYQNALNGYQAWVTAKLADPDGVKKMPELKALRV